VGLNLREALKQQLAIIHARVEAKKIAKLALAEVRELLAKEQEEKELELGRKEIAVRVKERLATKLKDEEESARPGLCRITSPNPQSIRTAWKVGCCLAEHEAR